MRDGLDCLLHKFIRCRALCFPRFSSLTLPYLQLLKLLLCARRVMTLRTLPQVLERLKAVEATLAALRAQIQPPAPAEITGTGPTAAAERSAQGAAISPTIVLQTPANSSQAARAAPADANARQSSHPVAPGVDARNGWLSGLGSLLNRTPWQCQPPTDSRERDAQVKPKHVTGSASKGQELP